MNARRLHPVQAQWITLSTLFVALAAAVACGGPDFTTAPPAQGEGPDATGNDRDNTPIILPDQPGDTETTTDAGEGSGDATVVDGKTDASAERDGGEASIDATVETGDAMAEAGRADASDGGDATPEAAAIDASEGGACSSGQLSCDGGCASPADIHSCGSCSNDCSLLANVSAAGLACNQGRCSYRCAAGYADCADAGTGCAAGLSTSPNCGSCGTTCSGGTPLCSPSADGGSACVSGCPASTPTLCNGSCVDTMTSAANCTTCGNACNTTIAHAQPVCAGGACTSTCAPGYSLCSQACVDKQTDNNNCGSCGTICAGGTTCVTGQCVCNATSCSSGCCVGNTCQSMPTWCLDADGDGYGNPATKVPACSQPPGAYVANCADCCDTDKRANPAQTGWFSGQNGGTTDNCGSWDYNCSGQPELEYTNLSLCPTFSCAGSVADSNDQCVPNPGCIGYLDANPGCGTGESQANYMCIPSAGPNTPCTENTVTTVPDTAPYPAFIWQGCH